MTKLVAMTFEEASRWIASQETRIRELEERCQALNDKWAAENQALRAALRDIADGDLSTADEIRAFAKRTLADSETPAEQGCEHCGSIDVNPKCPACNGIERDA